MSGWGFDLTTGIAALQQVGDRFTALKDELEQSIEDTIRLERFGGLAGAHAGGELQGCRAVLRRGCCTLC